MSDITITKVETADQKKEFILCQYGFYKGDPNFVPPLQIDRKVVFNPKKNPFFDHAKTELFLAKRGGKIVGRVAANTGLPTVLGWPGHEWQWRGSDHPEPGRREAMP